MKYCRIIVSTAIIVLVLFSSTSFMIGVHFCGGHVQNISLFTKADVCGMEKQSRSCREHQKSCCDDASVVHHGEHFKASANEVALAKIFPTEIDLPYRFVVQFIPVLTAKSEWLDAYDPPLQYARLERPFLQIFLI